MEKVAAAPIPKPASQPENAEVDQRMKEQEDTAAVASVYSDGAVFSDGRGVDLTGVPVRGEDMGGERDVLPAVDAGLIVEEDTGELRQGQMSKALFLRRLRSGIVEMIEPVLARVGQTTEGCPYLNYWLDFYEGEDAVHVEQTVKKYAPESVYARTAEQYIDVVVKRALYAAEVWARTGRLSGVPAGVPTTLPDDRNAVFQAKEKNGSVAGPVDARAIRDELGEGQPLPGDVRSRMEQGFGVNFSHVRTHTDSKAAVISDRVNARAFTVGEHVAFGSGEYRPGTLLGDVLIAHELAHTIQQKGNSEVGGEMEVNGASYNTLEMEADRAAIGVVSSLWQMRRGEGVGRTGSSLTHLRSGLRLQRCSKDLSVSSDDLGSDHSLWYFCGETQAGFATTARVRAGNYSNAASVRWQISRGADKVEFTGGNTGAEVSIRGRAGSSTAQDVQLDATESGNNAAHILLSVRKPHRLEMVGAPNDQGSCPSWASACHPPVWYTRITYRIKDNLSDTVSSVDVNEHFPGTKTNDVPNNWISPAAFSSVPYWAASQTGAGSFIDHWSKWGGNPSPVAPTAPNAGSSVDRLPHEFYVGSITPTHGCRVQTHTAHRYRGYARHEGITTPAP